MLLLRLTRVLARRSKNHPVLLGTCADCAALVHDLACALARGDVPETLVGMRLYSFDVARVAAGARDPAELEQRLEAALALAQSKDQVVFFVEGLLQPLDLEDSLTALDAADALRRPIRHGRMRIIGRAETNRYRERIESRDMALARSFQPILLSGA